MSAPRAGRHLFNTEPQGNSNRLMISPLLSREKTCPQIVTHEDDWYAARVIKTGCGARVTAIDPGERRGHAPGGAVANDAFVIATGSTARPATSWPLDYSDDRPGRFVNERNHANIQKDSTCSVVPHMWGGVTPPDALRAIA